MVPARELKGLAGGCAPCSAARGTRQRGTDPGPPGDTLKCAAPRCVGGRGRLCLELGEAAVSSPWLPRPALPVRCPLGLMAWPVIGSAGMAPGAEGDGRLLVL